MKCYLTIILAICILFSTIDSRRLRSHRYHRTGTGGNLFQFGIGLATQLVGGANIDNCLPAGWKNATPQPEEKDAEENVVSEKSTWEKILAAIGTAINVVCAVKDIVQNVIEYFTKSAKRRLHRYVRLFLQGKIRGKFVMKWSLSGFFSGAATAISNAASAVAKKAGQAWQTVKNGANAAAEWVGKEVGKITDAIKDALTNIFEKVITFFEGIRVKIQNFFKSGLMAKIMELLKCLKALKEAAGNISTLITGFTEKAALVASFPVGWIKILIGLICAWEDLRDAINFLIAALKETDPLKKWNGIGKFVGKLIYVIGTS